MRSIFVRLLAPAIASAALLGTAAAQPDVRDHRTPKEERREARRPPPPPEADARPREAPPAPRAEKQDPPRRGFVWVRGHWEWKAGKWDWVNGRWERERAGKKWRDVRWELRDGYYTRVEGGWVDQGANDPVGPAPGGSPPIVPDGRVPPPGPGPGGPPPIVPEGRVPPPGPGAPPPIVPEGRVPPPGPAPGGSPPIVPEGRRPPREWKLERPVVSSYWPARGKEGTRIVIRGRNFPTDATVVWAGAPVRAAKVAKDQIVFQVPPGAASGPIAVRTGRGRDLAVGTFEVAAAFDPEAEAKKLEEERRRKAEAAWIERQKQLAKDRAAREAAWRQREEERARSREQRRADRAAALRAKWDRAFLADAETQDELTLHAQRVAELVRMREVAELSSNGKLAVRIEIAQAREDERHDQRMAALKATFQPGGTP